MDRPMAKAMLVICKGLPGSGKTTWARGVQASVGCVRVNRDELRRMFIGHRSWTREDEDLVVRLRDHAISVALRDGRDVISDDMNLDPKHMERFKTLVELHSQIKVNDSFLRVPLEECIARQAQRPALERVPEHVIRALHDRWVVTEPTPGEST